MTKPVAKRRGNLVKTLILVAVLLVAVTISLIKNGPWVLLEQVLTLIISALAGFVLFFVGYFIFYAIHTHKKRKIKNVTISCDEEISKIVESGKYRFSYDRKLPLVSNISKAFNLAISSVNDVANGYKAGGKYYYLNYTVYDAISILETAIDGLDSKLTFPKPLKFLENTPISLLEKKLKVLIENEEEQAPSKVKQFFLKGAEKVGVFVFRGAIEKAFNDAIVYATTEAFRIYSKSGKDFDFTLVKGANNE